MSQNPAGTVAVQIPGNTTGPTAPTPEATPNPNRPAWLPAKFNSPEDFAKSYNELEKKLGSQQPPATPPAQQTTPPATEAPKLGEPVTPPAQQQAPAKPDLSKYEQEFNTNGTFSDQSYAELANLGISRQMADQYAQGVKAHQAQTRAEIHAVVGGEQQFNAVMQWAQQGLSEAEKNAYNAAVQSGNVAQIKLAVAGMQAKYQQTYGRDPNLIGGKPATSGPEAFSSWNQVVKAMSDSRYNDDPAYRAEVEARIAVSKNL